MNSGRIKFYGYDRCGTCVKARKFLDQNQVEYQLIAIREVPPNLKELKDALKQLVDIKKLFNTSGKDYREGNWKKKIVVGTLNHHTEDEILNSLSENGNLIKRPFVVTPKGYLVGFREEEWKNILTDK